MRGRNALAAVAVAALLTACGGDAEPEAAPSTTPPAATTPPPTSVPPTSDVPPSEAVVRLTLMEAAIAQESYSVDAGTYTTDVAKLAENGFDGEAGVTVTVVSANRQSYCMKAVGGTYTAYYSSATGKPSETPCS